MRNVCLFLSLCIALMAMAQQEPPVLTVAQHLEDFDYAVKYIEDNYSGFSFWVVDSTRADYEATKARLRYMTKSTLADLDTSKAVLDIFIQQANKIIFTDKSGKTRRLLTDQSYGEWSKKIDEIGALIGGWMNSVSGRKSGDSRGNAP